MSIIHKRLYSNKSRFTSIPDRSTRDLFDPEEKQEKSQATSHTTGVDFCTPQIKGVVRDIVTISREKKKNIPDK